MKSVTTITKPFSSLPSPGLEWKQALKDRKVFNAKEACDYLGMTSDQLNKEWAKAKKAGGGVDLALGVQETAWLQKAGVPVTDDSDKFMSDAEVPAKLLAVFTEDGFLKDGAAAGADASVGLVLDKSSFYAESGGQVASPHPRPWSS